MLNILKITYFSIIILKNRHMYLIIVLMGLNKFKDFKKLFRK